MKIVSHVSVLVKVFLGIMNWVFCYWTAWKVPHWQVWWNKWMRVLIIVLFLKVYFW